MCQRHLQVLISLYTSILWVVHMNFYLCVWLMDLYCRPPWLLHTDLHLCLQLMNMYCRMLWVSTYPPVSPAHVPVLRDALSAPNLSLPVVPAHTHVPQVPLSSRQGCQTVNPADVHVSPVKRINSHGSFAQEPVKLLPGNTQSQSQHLILFWSSDYYNIA